ncbi:DUF1127 domain-containing protein [Cereibacter changlensis]|uniref:DUF1127 domain-containing protein n=1 Tax=Cereibacter changlensis TaxID=402884 RepID=UPI0040345620
MFLSRLLCRLQARRSMGWLLTRHDDRLLRDIGLTRDDLETMLSGADDSRSGRSVEAGLSAMACLPCKSCG